MQALMGLSYLSSITSHFLNVLHWMVFDLIFYCVTVNCNALFNQISTHCRTLPTHSKIITVRFQWVEKRCNAFSMHFSMHFRLISYAEFLQIISRVTYRL